MYHLIPPIKIETFDLELVAWSLRSFLSNVIKISIQHVTMEFSYMEILKGILTIEKNQSLIYKKIISFRNLNIDL